MINAPTLISVEYISVPKERLRKLVWWMKEEQGNLTCSDLCDKTFEMQGCPSGTCALEDGIDEIAWWERLLFKGEPNPPAPAEAVVFADASEYPKAQ